MARARNPQYVYKEDSKGRVHAYRPIACENCGKEALARVNGTGRFCSHECSTAWLHANGKIPDRPRAEDAPGWKGGEATYSAMHKRVVRLRGPADHCERRDSAGCHSLTCQWAWIHDTDPGDPQNYRQLCRECHAAYDEHVGSGNARAKFTQEDADAIRARYAGGGITQPQLAAQYGVSQATISNILLYRRYVR